MTWDGILDTGQEHRYEGPFPTELDDPIGAGLRERGGEYGVTTGRPRRCGWIDLVALRHAVRINGINELALTKLDVLSGLETVRVCIAYRVDGAVVDRFPLSGDKLARCQPVYESLAGWREPLAGATSRAQLPRAAGEFVRFIEGALEVPVGIVSYGPAPEETITTSL